MARGARLLGLFFVSVAFGCGGKSMTAPAGNSSSGSSSPGPSSSLTASIGVQDAGFTPSVDTVRLGTAVTWTNGGMQAHTVTSDGGLFDSGQLGGMSTSDPYGYGSASPGGSFQRTFATVGSYPFHCSNHVWMTGTIVVTP